VLAPPASYKPIMTPARKLMATPTPYGMVGGATPLYALPEENQGMKAALPELEGLPELKPEDAEGVSNPGWGGGGG
jgi:splicing factor 3B subunit 1